MLSQCIESITSSYFGLAPGPFLALNVTLVFLSGAMILIAGIFASRILKSRHKKLADSLRFQYQKILNKIVVNEMYSEGRTADAAFEFYMGELRLYSGTSSLARQLLLSQILENKKNLTGNSATVLVKTYYALSLQNESCKKLKAFKWQEKALAIREFAEMNHAQSIPLIEHYLYSGKQNLREECLMALVRLEEKPLSFLDHYKGEISKWMRINIYRFLQNTDTRRLPVFSRYFNHSNLSVRLFCISMARRFKQSSSLPGLLDLIYSDNAQVVGLAVSALGDLDAYQYRHEIARLANHVWRFEKLSRKVVACLGKIGDPETDVGLVGKFLGHPCYPVRFEAVSALKKLGSHGEKYLHDFNLNSNQNIKPLLRHFSEPLLN